MRKAYKILVENNFTTLTTYARKCYDIKLDLRATMFEQFGWIPQTLNKHKWQVPMVIEITDRIFYNEEIFLNG
jgi:hypothetical protein